MYIHISTRSHGLQATSAHEKELPLSRSGTLIINLATTSHEPSNRQSANTALRSNPTPPDYRGKPYRELPSDASLPDKLNAFYVCIEASNTEPCMTAPAVPDDCVVMLSIADVSKTFKEVTIHKAAGPDGLPE